jgi:hypothetical protein
MLSAGIRLGPYEILALIGAGGFPANLGCFQAGASLLLPASVLTVNTLYIFP